MASDKPNITQAWSGDELVVKVVEVEACGLLIKNSNAVVDGNRLNLKYEYYSNGSVMKCFCEYSTEFRFRSLPIKIYDIDFASSYGRSLFEKFMDFCIKFK